MIVALPTIKTSQATYLSPHFGRAQYFTFAEVSDNEYKVLEVVENPYIEHEHRKGKSVIGFLASRNVNAVIALGIGYGAFARLKELGIKVYYVPTTPGEKLMTVEKALEMFINNQLKEATEAREFD